MLEQWRGCPGPLFRMFFYEPNRDGNFPSFCAFPVNKIKYSKPGMCLPLASLVAQSVKNLPANAGDRGSISRSGRSPAEGNGNPLQYSSLVHPMDRGAWWAAVHGVARIRHDLVTKPPASCVLVVQNPRATCDRAALIRAESSQRTDGQEVRGADGRGRKVSISLPLHSSERQSALQVTGTVYIGCTTTAGGPLGGDP